MGTKVMTQTMESIDWAWTLKYYLSTSFLVSSIENSNSTQFLVWSRLNNNNSLVWRQSSTLCPRLSPVLSPLVLLGTSMKMSQNGCLFKISRVTICDPFK